jgi:hypothetical protein
MIDAFMMMIIHTLDIEIVVNVVLSYKVEMRLNIKHGLIYGISGKVACSVCGYE